MEMMLTGVGDHLLLAWMLSGIASTNSMIGPNCTGPSLKRLSFEMLSFEMSKDSIVKDAPAQVGLKTIVEGIWSINEQWMQQKGNTFKVAQ